VYDGDIDYMVRHNLRYASSEVSFCSSSGDLSVSGKEQVEIGNIIVINRHQRCNSAVYVQ